MNGCALTVFGVQPLALRRADHALSLSDLMLSGRRDVSDQDIGDQTPQWVTALEGIYPNRHFMYRRIEDLPVLDDALPCAAMSVHLCSNTVLNQHLVVFELRGSVDDPAAIDAGFIRALLVKPARATDDKRPRAVREAITRAISMIEAAHVRAGSRETYATGDITVERDSCNVTMFLDPGVKDCIRLAEDGELDLDLAAPVRDAAERVSADRIVLRVSDDTEVFFGGRVHHVISSAPDDVDVIKHIMLTLQAMWFFVPCYLRAASRWHRQIIDEQSSSHLDELEWAAKRLIHIYQTVHLQNEFAKYAWGAMCGAVSDPCQQRWGVERSIAQFERFATFFGAFIKDVREVQSSRSERMLNYVLAALGLFGLVDLWANVLDSQVSAADIGSWGRLGHLMTHSMLGLGTLVMLAVSTALGGWLVAYNRRPHRGRRKGKSRGRRVLP